MKPAKSQDLTDTLMERLLQRVNEMDLSGYVLLKSSSVVTLAVGGMTPVLTIEYPNSYVFDQLADHLAAIRYAAMHVFEVCELIVWRQLAPGVSYTPLSDVEWVERARTRQQHADSDVQRRGYDD